MGVNYSKARKSLYNEIDDWLISEITGINPIALKRKVLKTELKLARVVFTKKGYRSVCAWCDEPILFGFPDMHEAIITRGDAQKNNILMSLIMVKYNCCLTHTGQCHLELATEKGLYKAMDHIINYEGVDNVLDWLYSLLPVSRSPTVSVGISLVEDAWSKKVILRTLKNHYQLL